MFQDTATFISQYFFVKYEKYFFLVLSLIKRPNIVWFYLSIQRGTDGMSSQASEILAY